MQNAKNIQRLEILDGEKCNCVFDYLLKVLSPFTAPKAAHRIHNMTIGFLRIFKKEIGEELLENRFLSIFQKQKNWKTNGMLGNLSERKIGERKSWEMGCWVIRRGSRQRDFWEHYLLRFCSSFLKDFASPGGALQVDLQGMSSLLLLQQGCLPCKSPAFSPIKFHIFPDAK